jgi:hypothetical protein
METTSNRFERPTSRRSFVLGGLASAGTLAAGGLLGFKLAGFCE